MTPLSLNRVSTEIAWWIPGGSLVYSGTPKTRAEWIRLTWSAYLAYWHMVFIAALVMLRDKNDGGAA